MPYSAVPVLDGEQLGRRTMGDPALQVELLSLFVAEAERLMLQVERAPDPQIRGDRLRALSALARNTGAARLAQAARMLETQITEEEPDLQPLRAVVAETIAHIGRTGG